MGPDSKVPANETTQFGFYPRYGIDMKTERTDIFGTIPCGQDGVKQFEDWSSLLDIQRILEPDCINPIFYENRAIKLARQGTTPSPQAISRNGASSEGEQAPDGQAKTDSIPAPSGAIQSIAEDLVEHWIARRRMREGKAAVVCLNRAACLQLHQSITLFRPDWKEAVEVAHDPFDQTSKENPKLSKRFQNPLDPLEVVFVDMTCMEVVESPVLNTVYSLIPVPKEMNANVIHRLMRLFEDRLGMLVVDYVLPPS